MTQIKMTAARQAAYATISAAMGGSIPAGHKDWLDAQDDARVVSIADEFHQPEDEEPNRQAEGRGSDAPATAEKEGQP